VDEGLPIGRGKFSVGKRDADVYLVKAGKQVHKLGVLDDSNRTLREAFEAYLRPSDARHTRLTIDRLRSSLHREKEALGATPASLKKYDPAMKLLDPRDPLSEASVARAISSTKPNTQHRRMVASYFKFACDLHGVPWTPRLIRLSQKGQIIKRKKQPFFTDEQLEAQCEIALQPHWQKVHRLLMVYGLRPWEAFIAEPCQKYPRNVWIGEGKKVARGETTPRSVPPYHKHWYEQYNLADLLQAPNFPSTLSWPKLKRTANNLINQRFRSNGLYGMEASSYGYRHAYARRLHLQYDVKQAHGAVYMGHSLATHLKVYQQWLEVSSDPYAEFSD
jgi:hypothetical protein